MYHNGLKPTHKHTSKWHRAPCSHYYMHPIPDWAWHYFANSNCGWANMTEVGTNCLAAFRCQMKAMDHSHTHSEGVKTGRGKEWQAGVSESSLSSWSRQIGHRGKLHHSWNKLIRDVLEDAWLQHLPVSGSLSRFTKSHSSNCKPWSKSFPLWHTTHALCFKRLRSDV